MLHLADQWETLSDVMSDAPALLHGDTRRSWREFEDRAARLATGFGRLGIRAGETVMIDMFNCSEYLETFFAVLKMRAVPANMNYRYVGPEAAMLLDASDAVAIVYQANLYPRVAEAIAESRRLRVAVQLDDVGDSDLPPGFHDYDQLIADSDPAPRISRSEDDVFLSFTGGTTGLPKGVVYNIGLMTKVAMSSRAGVLGVAVEPNEPVVPAALRLQESGESPVAVPASPLMHSAGLQHTAVPALTAGGCVITLQGRSFDPHELLRVVESRRVSSIAVVGDAFARPLLRALQQRAEAGSPYDISSLRVLSSSGAPWSSDVKRGILEHAPQLVLSEACGSTEGAHYGNRLTRFGDPTSTGNFVAQAGVKIVDENRSPVAPGQIGAIISPTPAQGYFHAPEATEKVYFIVDGVQYVAPGDLGRLEPDGTITLLGRGSTMINSGGEKIFPGEVEQALIDHPGVDDALVLGIPDERFGQVVSAVVQVAASEYLDRSEITAHLQGQLASYKLPRVMVFGEVPRLPNGKPDYDKATGLVLGDG